MAAMGHLRRINRADRVSGSHPIASEFARCTTDQSGQERP
jgi:hypothetical protein